MTSQITDGRFDLALSMARLQAQAKPTGAAGKAREQAQDFEAMFLNSMFQSMQTDVAGEGPFGGSAATGVWRSFLTNEHARIIARQGGIGIADHIYNALIAQQAADTSAAPRSVQQQQGN